MRREDWLPLMWRTLHAAEARPFSFGNHDCVRLVAAVIDAMTGSDWELRTNEWYSDARGALRIMQTPGELERLVSAALAREPLPIGLARRGDIVALNLEHGPALGVCVGERVAVASDGVLYLPLARAHCVWRIE